jgi:hypothetical protein
MLLLLPQKLLKLFSSFHLNFVVVVLLFTWIISIDLSLRSLAHSLASASTVFLFHILYFTVVDLILYSVQFFVEIAAWESHYLILISETSWAYFYHFFSILG